MISLICLAASESLPLSSINSSCKQLAPLFYSSQASVQSICKLCARSFDSESAAARHAARHFKFDSAEDDDDDEGGDPEANVVDRSGHRAGMTNNRAVLMGIKVGGWVEKASVDQKLLKLYAVTPK